MFKIFALFACVSIVAAIPVIQPSSSSYDQHDYKNKEVAQIVSSELNKNDDGSYHLQFSGSDGTSRQEDASLVDAGTKGETLEVKGSYKYLNEDGSEVEVFYTAGKNGFVPHGSIINPEITAVAEAAKDLPSHEDDDVDGNKYNNNNNNKYDNEDRHTNVKSDLKHHY